MPEPVAEVAVVLALYRPRMQFLMDQVASLLTQDGCPAELFLLEDGGSGCAEVATFAQAQPRVMFRTGEINQGAADTFLDALEWALASGSHRFLAFSDQDDVWEHDKLRVSVDLLTARGSGAVHTDARIVDESMREIAPSMVRLEHRDVDPVPLKLLFRNPATGMTMVLERSVAEAAVAFRALRPSHMLHDHFVSVLAMAGHGLSFIDRPLVRYRQHGANQIGSRAPGSARSATGAFLRADSVIGRFVEETDVLVRALLASDYPSAEGRARLEQAAAVLNRRGPSGALTALRAMQACGAGNRSARARVFVRALTTR